MEIREAKERLDRLEREMFAYKYALGLIEIDSTTVAPPETQEGRSLAVGTLSAQSYRIMTSPELWEAVETLYGDPDAAGPSYFRRSEILRRSIIEQKAVPADEYADYTRLVSEAGYVWHKAKNASDFASFRPYLEKLVSSRKHIAELTS